MRYGYMRPNYTRIVWGAVIALALLAALVWAGVLTVRAIREDERRVVLLEGAALFAKASARTDALVRERDSLRVVVARVDTVLVSRLRTVRDTAWLPADTSAPVRLAACRLALDSLATDCERYRVTATAALANADSLHRADSTAAHAQAIIAAGITRSRDAALTQLASHGKRRSFERGVCVASLATNYLQWRSR
ncbi:MAG: hypothetical protein HEQ38_17055 [Gemmatimonas sp.]|nr:hypothetical protein [Gemmatimonas sp.]